jgi:hypothetical protein
MSLRFAQVKPARAAACVLLLWAVQGAVGQQNSWTVRHQHVHKGAMGTLRVTADTISFEELDKKGRPTADSHQWRIADIQQLTLGRKTLHIRTYEDQKWQLGRDRVYDFDHLPAELVTQLYAEWRDRLDSRFVATLADDQVHPEWQIAAKLVHGRSGSQGIIRFGADRIVYDSPQDEESRTWRIRDIENVATSGPFDLTITAHEGEFRFQLKETLAEDRYNRLWRQVSQANGLQTLITNK